MYISSADYRTYLTPEDIQKLTQTAKYLINRITLPQVGLYQEVKEENLWEGLVFQLCSIGGGGMLENLMEDADRFEQFKRRISLKYLTTVKNKRIEYVAETLKDYKATKFYNKQAEKINALLDNTQVVDGSRLVLLRDIDHNRQDYADIRKRLISRNPYFRFKSASGYMIEYGLSIDVIALDSRSVDILKRHFGLKVDSHKLQNTRYLYESVENGLRRGCEQIGIPLAYLDRMLFHYSAKNAVSFILEDL